ncbi:hypothetical protein [Alteraurantiacibacter buctensis]|nr:hypothetical protein [Alteraurantiacibacter buctensis]
MIPRFSLARWGGGDPDYRGWSFDIEWLGCILEINIGRADA